VRGGGNDFQATVELLERLGEPWCLIGGLAINVYCEPVYTNDADFIVVTSQLELVCAELAGLGFTISRHSRLRGHPPYESSFPRSRDHLRLIPRETLRAIR